MAFSSALPLLLLLLSTADIASAAAAAAAAAPSSGNATIYEILPLYGLPPGIFPDTVASFSLSPDGALSVNLSGPCYADFDYLIYYAPTITGFLHYGSLVGLSGIQARRFLIWFDVDRIKVGTLLFLPYLSLVTYYLNHIFSYSHFSSFKQGFQLLILYIDSRFGYICIHKNKNKNKKRWICLLPTTYILMSVGLQGSLASINF